MRGKTKINRVVTVGAGDFGRLILSHRDGLVCRISLVVREAVGRRAEGTYNSDQLLDRIWAEIQKSVELFRGFVSGNSGVDIHSFFKGHFSVRDLEKIVDRATPDLLTLQEAPEGKHVREDLYIGATVDEEISRIVRVLRGLESHSSDYLRSVNTERLRLAGAT